MTTVLWVGGIIALLLLVIGVYTTVTSERSIIEERLGRYLEETEQAASSAEERGSATKVITDWLNSLVVRTRYGDRISEELARADLKFKPGEYLVLMLAAGFLGALAGYYFGGGSSLLAVAGLFFGGFILPRIVVKRQQGARLKKFNEQLPDMLNLMVNSLRAGFSTLQAMEAVSKELPHPISSEFRRVVQEMQLGIPMERALENLLRRIPSDDLDLVITAINVQREVGGNLAEILETISHTIRERVRVKGEIRALTAQVSYSGRFLALIPLLLSLALWGINREYMMQFFIEPKICGIGILALSAVMIVIGYLVMEKIGDIEV